MSVPTAKEMADALKQTGTALLNKQLITSSYVFYESARNAISHGSENVSWDYEISESNPIEFRRIYNKHINKDIRPRIYASISVQRPATGGVCFNRLDLALEVLDDEDNVLIKHHIDFANSPAGQFQEGPLFHLQFGGHTPGNTKSFEVPIKEPRWLCIPLDVVLLCEVVVANFYPAAWEELKDLPGWNGPIGSSQKLCIIPFLNALQSKAGISTRSLLDHMWASTVGPSYAKAGFP